MCFFYPLLIFSQTLTSVQTAATLVMRAPGYAPIHQEVTRVPVSLVTSAMVSHAQVREELCSLIFQRILWFINQNNSETSFLRCFKDPIRVPRIENLVPRIRENYYRVPRIRKIGSLESEKSGPYRSIPGT